MDLKDKNLILPNQDELSNKDVVSFYDSFSNLLKLIENNSKFTKNISKVISSGKKTIYNKTVTETKEYETTFLDTLESAFPAFSKIAKNPKMSIKYEDDIVQVEKARKVNSESIKHLASHSQFVKELKNDNVIPSKILTQFADEDLAIYENRLYKTLVNNIVRFLTRRKQMLADNLESFRVDEIKYTNDLELNKSNSISIGLSIKVKKTLQDEIETSKEILRRTQDLLLAYKGLKSTPFLRGLQNAKDVFPPIMKTNIILHNPDFKIVYNTWVFMERYSSVTFNVNVKDDDFKADPNIDEDLGNISLILLNTLLYHRNLDVDVNETSDLIKYQKPEFKLERNKEFDIKPGEVEVDDYAFSELFLNEAAKYFESDFEKNQIEGVRKEVSLKEAVRKMLQIINHMGPSVFGYKDNDLDEIGKDTKTLVKEAEARYNALKIYREEKELDLENNKNAEEKALEHLNKLKGIQALEEHERNLEINKMDVKAMQEKLEAERKALEEAQKHQEELRKQNQEALKRAALEKELAIKSRGYHNRKHEKKIQRQRVKLQYFDTIEDGLLNLFGDYDNYSMKSRRDYENSDRLSYSDILDKLYAQEMYEKAKQKEIEDKFFKAFKYKNKHNREEKKNRIQLQIKKTRTNKNATTLNLFDEPINCRLVQRRFDIFKISDKYREPILIEFKPKKVIKKVKKIVGVKKTVVKKKKLATEEIKKINKKKVIGSKKKLITKKTIIK